MKQEATIDTSTPSGDANSIHSDRRQMLDDACARVGRLEAVLAATGGTLHDVNNLLTVLSGNLYLLTEAVRGDSTLLARCRTARNTAQRAGELIRELLCYARGQDESTGVVCPSRHVQSMQALLRRGIDAVHDFRVECDKDAWFAAASAAQFESAIANLVINAQEAMSSPGVIEVRVSNTSVSKKKAASQSEEERRDFVRITVKDSGSGIPADMLQKVTQPLYTTKPRGKGNGMGLAMVKAFAENSGGHFKIESEPGKGTKISIWLPRQARPADATASMTIPISTLPAGDETVLLVTADSAARSTIAQLLDALGYTVLQSEDPTDALRLAREQQPISLLICDRSARTQAEELDWLCEIRDLAPDIRQVALLDPGADAAQVAADAHSFVQLPIAVPNLARSIRAALENRQ